MAVIVSGCNRSVYYIDVATYKEFSVHIVNYDNLSKPLKSKIKSMNDLIIKYNNKYKT